MAISDGLKLVLLIGFFKTSMVSAREKIPADDTRILFIHGPTYDDNTPYTLYQADDLANDSSFQDGYTGLFIPDLLVTQYSQYHPVAEAYATLSDVNFLQVDWGNSATDESDAKLPDVEKLKSLLGDFIIQLLNHVERENLHLVAYSSGVELAWKVTRDYIAKTGSKLARLTVLDPPTSQMILQKRLLGIYNHSVDFTDAIHTSAINQGTLLRIGHADFWPNGGIMQPGCNIGSDQGLLGCSHQRAGELYSESVRNRDSGPQFCSYGVLNFINLFKTMHFGEPVIMGINCDPSARGHYFLATKSSSPYAWNWCPK